MINPNDYETFKFIMATVIEARVSLNFNSEENVLFTRDGCPVYWREERSRIWVPVVPEEISEELAPDQQPELDSAMLWSLAGRCGKISYYWDTRRLKWISVNGRHQSAPSHVSQNGAGVEEIEIDSSSLPESSSKNGSGAADIS